MALWTTQPIPVVPAQVDEPAPGKPAGMHLVAAIGLVLVIYSYLVGLWPVRHGFTPDVVLAGREWLNFPLGIGADFGLLGVGLLLAAGGFWACGQLTGDGLRLAAPAGSGLRLTGLRGGGRRLAGLAVVRGYLPYALACTISWLLLLGRAQPLTSPRAVDPSAGTFPANLGMVDRLTGQDALLGLGWGVAVAGCTAVLFTATAALLTSGRWLALLGLAVQLAVVAGIALTAAGAGGWYHDLGLLLTWCVFPLLGQLVWVVHSHAGGGGWAAALIGVGCLALLVAAERSYTELGGMWLPLTWTYAALVVLLAARAAAHGGRADRGHVVRWLGSRAYLAGLFVCAIGYPLIGALYRVDVPFWVGLPLAVAVTLGIAEVVYRLTGALAR